MRRRPLLLALAMSLGVTAVAAAQNPGLPVYNNGVGTGIQLQAEAGFPNTDAGKGTAYGLTGELGLGPLGVSATVSNYDPKNGSSHTSFGGTVNFKVFGGPLIPFAITLQGGAAHTDLGTFTMWRFPVGVGLTATIPTTVVAIHPWIAPRLDVVRISNGSSNTDSNFGISGGIDFNLLSGLGFSVAYDRVTVDGASPAVIGVGVHYAIKVPGL
ncbi:MAG: hypothetical protein AB7I33_02195 [Gemmatimonadales bacterium]